MATVFASEALSLYLLFVGLHKRPAPASTNPTHSHTPVLLFHLCSPASAGPLQHPTHPHTHPHTTCTLLSALLYMLID